MKQIIIILCLFFSLSSAGAQSWQLFNMLVKQGNYSDAKKILVVLDNVDPKTMSSVNACIKLQEEAEALYQKEYYTRSIEKYRQIQKYFPSDETVEICIRQCEIKRDEYNRIQEQIRHEERKRQTISAEKALWNKAVYANTIDGYLEYIYKYPSGQFHNLAEMILKGLYENDAQKKFRLEKYDSAIYSFSKASKYGALTQESKQMFSLAKEKIAQQEEEKRYKSLKTGYKYTNDFEYFLRDYPNSRYASEIRGKLIDKYCGLGRFDEARELVKKFPKGIELTNEYTPDVEWWMKYIGQRERNFSKALRNHPDNIQRNLKRSSFSMFDDVGIMLSLGGTISFAKNPRGAAYVGPRLSFSIGDIYNSFNLEVSMSGMFQRPDNAFEIQLPLAIGPRWNIIANDFVIFIQPEIGYDILHKGLYYAGRTGLGGDWGSIYVGVAYNREAVDLAQIQVGCIWSWMWDL